MTLMITRNTVNTKWLWYYTFTVNNLDIKLPVLLLILIDLDITLLIAVNNLELHFSITFNTDWLILHY